ncbi:hypothetical protein Tco_0313839 [Tanacetum coccineum]
MAAMCSMRFRAVGQLIGPQHKLGIRNSKPSKFDCFQVQVVQIILWYLDSGCSKLDLEEEMAPVRISSGPEPKMMFGQNSSSLVLHQMMSAQISSGLAPQCLKMFEHSSSSLGLHCQKTFKQISSNLVSQMSQRRLLASLQAPFLKEKKGVRFSALYLQQKRNLLVLDHSHQQVSNSLDQKWQSHMQFLKGRITTRKLPVVEVKGKGSATDVQAAKSLLELHKPKKLMMLHPQDGSVKTSIHADVNLVVGSNSEQSHVALAGSNPEHMHDVFLATNYPKVHESLKHTTKEHVHLENPPSSSRTLSSMKNLEDS